VMDTSHMTCLADPARGVYIYYRAALVVLSILLLLYRVSMYGKKERMFL